jgi:Na+/proline symporter
MVNEMQAERRKRGDQESAEESILSYGPVWLVLALGLACGIGFLGSSAFLRNYGGTSGELRLIVMLLLFPVEWGGALLILALLGDLRRAVEEGRSRVPADE